MIARPQLPSSTRLRSELKRRIFTSSETAQYRYRATRYPNAAATRVLLLTDFREYTSDQQYAPIMRNNTALYVSGEINSTVSDVAIAFQRRNSFLKNFDIIGLKLSYQTPPEDALRVAIRLKEQMATSAKLFYFDGDDDLNVQWPDVLQLADKYIKKHTFADRHAYGRIYAGKSNLSDYAARVSDNRYADAHALHSGPIAATDADKIQTGWNIGLDDRIIRIAKNGMTSAVNPREVDICGRATANKNDWVFPLRQPMLEQLSKLSHSFRVAIPTSKVPLDEYYRELKSSTICVSPFGWGEICWRDFEAILSGCLLVKPDMSHVNTEPNIYVPYVTYIPVAWDYSNLGEVCSKYLADEAGRQKIVRCAQAVLFEALQPHWLVGRASQIFRPGAPV